MSRIGRTPLHNPFRIYRPRMETQGTSINEQTAIALRRIMFGQCPDVIHSQFFHMGPGMVFRTPESCLAYGLNFAQTNISPMAKCILTAIQAHVIRFLLFEVKPVRGQNISPLLANEYLQQDALSRALGDILWKVAGNNTCTVCLPHPTLCHVPQSAQFNQDGITEKLILFQMDSFEDTCAMLRRNIYIFQEDPGPGLLLFMYSVVLSRGVVRIATELEQPPIILPSCDSFKAPLMPYSGEINLSTLCLLLTGKLSLYLHNGILSKEGQQDKVGILVRSPIGLLLWMGSEQQTEAWQLGSRLKTPVLPIWVVVNCQLTSVLFSENRDLMRDYKAETRFHLHYFTSTHYQMKITRLAICTKKMTCDEQAEENEASNTPILDRIISTKWPGSIVDWKGIPPFI